MNRADVPVRLRVTNHADVPDRSHLMISSGGAG
jgi:hypothetical protein